MKPTVAGLIEKAGEALTLRRRVFRDTDEGETVVDSTSDVTCYGAPTPYEITTENASFVHAGDILIELEAMSFDNAGIEPEGDDLILLDAVWHNLVDVKPRKFQGETVSYYAHVRGGR
jgi:hypothetical protein